MKFEFIEGPGGTQITLTPETVEETSQLLRASKNAKAQPVGIYYSFNHGTQAPYCNIWIGAIHKDKQTNSVSNKRKGQ